MTRVLEFVVALIIVFALAVIVGLFLPSHGRIQRSVEISHNPAQIYDVLNNFRRFEDYAGGQLQAQDPNVKFSLSGPAYGPGATISWDGDQTLGDGKLVNKSGNLDITGNSTVTWALTNDWRGENKVFTFTVAPRQNHRVSTVYWAYDVDYGWNLLDRYSQLWIHGKPGALVQYGLGSLQNMLAGIPNVDYGNLNPGLYQTDATPVLMVSTKAPRTLGDIEEARTAALQQISDAMSKLGVEAAGPVTTITTEWGDTTYVFDVAVPINTATLKIGDRTYDLAKLPPRPTTAQMAAGPASPASTAGASSVASAASSAAASSADEPASASTSGAAPKGPAPGTLDKYNQLIVNDGGVRAEMLPARKVLVATWMGEAGIPLVRLALKAYAGTHGYPFNETNDRLYDQLVSMPNVSDADQVYRVFLPVQDAPAKTPEQISGRAEPLKPLDPALWSTGVQKGDNAKSEKSDNGDKKKSKKSKRTG